MTKEERIEYNRKRSNIISALRRKNLQEASHLEQYMNKNHHKHTPTQLAGLARLRKNITVCGAHSLYAEADGGVTYIGSHTCDNKNCHVCNWNRKKRIRRKLINWFRNNPTVIELTANGKIVTNTQYETKYHGENYQEREYDLMHLTLTVPHTAEAGWRGEQFYYKEIMQTFNQLRKNKKIKNYIYGGEFGVETTRNNKGLHIHIHSLLLVKKEPRNRDKLHRLILLEWNRLTIDLTHPETEFTPERIKAIKKGNQSLTLKDINQLHPQGATLIGLETIYIYDNNGNKQRSEALTEETIIHAVMETVSYHFKPLALEDNGHLNYELIAHISDKIYKRPLYKKFGCWHGEKTLNIKSTNDIETVLEDYADATEIIRDEESGVLINQETGEIIDAGHRSYYMVDCAYVWHIPEEHYKIVFSRKARDKIKTLPAMTTADALMQMLDASIQATMRLNRKEETITV